ncbi:MAG: hypothetical protein HC837_01110 [Chloroflexaceae bacterium]|nr:hypothetical protein [Chloroflexaceae bacterium]
MAAINRILLILLYGALVTGVAVVLAALAGHIWLVLHYTYPLDYGEGPLLEQVTLLRSGIPFWEMYRDPGAPPYAVVNYPPLYPIMAAVLSRLGDLLTLPWFTPLLAGRLVSLIAAAGCVVALALLMDTGRSGMRAGMRRWLVACLFLTIPVVREWSVLMRVDLAGVCLGLWGLVALQAAVHPSIAAPVRYGWAIITAVFFLLSLYTKPSLIAAPAAGCLWLVLASLRNWQQPGHSPNQITLTALIVLALTGAGGGFLLVMLQWASDGWFLLHIVTANANRWDADLALLFWQDQIRLRWPLVLAGCGAVVWLWLSMRRSVEAQRVAPLQSSASTLLPIFYTLAGLIIAIGVGKVGAYANYFLELYAGLIWLIGVALDSQPVDDTHKRPRWHLLWAWSIPLLLLMSMAYYQPLWSKQTLHRAGQIEPNPPRLTLGRYSIWNDLQREAEILAAYGRVQAALVQQVAAAGPTIFTDIPGVAVQSGALSRVQIFEHRQLFDQGDGSQQEVLLELANGRLPLAVIDYLGNWLTPEMITLLQRRYAQDGSLADFDLYRPVDAGVPISTNLTFTLDHHDTLLLSGYALKQPASMTTTITTSATITAQPGELLVMLLEWQPGTQSESTPDPERHANTTAVGAQRAALQTDTLTVVLRLVNERGQTQQEDRRALLYGVLPPHNWPDGEPVQHMQPFTLAQTLITGTYRLDIGLESASGLQAGPYPLTSVAVVDGNGHSFAETGYFVPDSFLAAWRDLGGLDYAGYPLSPAVPFDWGTLQCFEHICLEQHRDDGSIRQRSLGEWLYRAETNRSHNCFIPAAPDTITNTLTICPAFRTAWHAYGREAGPGPPISGEIVRNGYIVQWTQYARLERLPGSSEVILGRLGDDVLQIPPGMRYRWP